MAIEVAFAVGDRVRRISDGLEGEVIKVSCETKGERRLFYWIRLDRTPRFDTACWPANLEAAP